ncbi:MAG: polyketide synthase PksL [Acidobacteriota bacterium]|nr:polyketide synthase PksL [Acidobacteriota bacterium]
MLQAKIKETIKQKAAAVLCLSLDEIDDNQRLSELGMDSIIGVELINTLNKTFYIDLKKSVLYDYPTVNRLTDYLVTLNEETRKTAGVPGGTEPGKIESAKEEPTCAAPSSPRVQLKSNRAPEAGSSPSPGLENGLKELEARFGKLPADLLSKYKTIPELAAYLVENHREKLMELSGLPVKKENKVLARAIVTPSDYGRRDDEDIAIIGISGRYPMAANLDMFWENLQAGKNCITEIPPGRWDYRDYYNADKDKPGKTPCKWGGFIDDIEMFDPLFFNISPREAATMDPQTRLLLESVWHTLEDAGYTRQELQELQADPRQRVGIFIGCMYQQYPWLAGKNELYAALSNTSYWSMVNRCSYFFDFKGPSIAIDTACSSSLTAVHMACESLRRGECAAVIAGGVNLNLHPSKYVVLSDIGLIGSEGKSCSLGQAEGYIPGEGIGTVLLRPLSAAQQHGDHIYAVIKGSEVNHGGSSEGFTVPNPKTQADLIASVLEKTGIDPRTIGYVETSATGSPRGDNAEIEALVDAFRRFTDGENFCAVGSVKANIGHLEAAAGISQLTRAALQLKHKMLVPSINAAPLNPGIHLEGTPFYIQQDCREWQMPLTDDGGTPVRMPRRACIDSFGAGGSNAHLLLEEYIEPSPALQPQRQDHYLIVLSARNEETLKGYALEMADFFGKLPGETVNLADIVYTLQVGREAMPERLAFIISDAAELQQRLRDFSRGKNENLYRGSVSEGKARTELLIEGEAGREFIRLVLKNKELSKLARLWVWGVDVEWKLLYPDPAPRRISLPVYPFMKKRYWLDSPQARQTRTDSLVVSRPGSDALPKARPAASQAQGIEKEEQVRAKVRNTLAEVLRLEDQDIDENRRFLDLGLDSILGVEFIKKLNETFHINLKTTVLYDYSTVKKMSRHLAEIVSTPGALTAVLKTGDGSGICKGLLIKGVGDIAGIGWSEIPVREPAEHEVRIRVKASALNFADILCVKGLYPTMPDYPFVAGFQAAGIVDWVGKNVNQYKPGDEVVAMMGANLGGHAEIVITPESLVQLKPAPISFEDMCGWPDAFVTAYYCLYEIGKLTDREHVLIQCAAGGVGLMAVQLAKLKNAVIYGTSSSPEKLAYLKTIGVDFTINYAEENVADRIKELSSGRGVDIVLNTIAGDALQQGIRSLAPGGRYLEIAVAGLKTSQSVDLSGMTDNQSFHSVDLRKLWFNFPQLGNYLQIMVEMASSGAITPIVTKSFPAEKVKDALEYIDQRKSIGKVVLTYPQKNWANFDSHAEKNSLAFQGNASTDIAVIGMSGRFPGAANTARFWDNLVKGAASITNAPVQRWDPNQTICKWGGLLDDIDKFDPLFFNISPMEAEWMDPQQRLFLEEAWKAIEDAGYSAESFAGRKCGVFVGVGTGDYSRKALDPAGNPDAFSLMGASNSILSGRVSYILDLTGPNMAVDTACSSSLAAVHLGCRSIINGESDLVIAGGVNVMTTPILHIMTGKAGMLSKDGKCKTFDNNADGFVPGEAAAVVILKPLSQALEDNDHIYGVIKGSSLNQDGQTNGITAPSVKSQVKLAAELYECFHIHPENILYVEAHGTGTKLGDPIEIDALTTAFARYTDKKQYCAIGSVKTNIGHGLAAAGISGLIKVLLCLEHKKLVPSLNFQAQNEHIDFQNSPFYVNTQLKDWERNGTKPIQAAVSSFGFSGTNAHLVLEEAPPPRRQPKKAVAKPYYLVALSARTKMALETKIHDLEAWMKEQGARYTLADIAFTLLVGRSHLPVRAALVAQDAADLARQLDALVKKGISEYDLRCEGKGKPLKPDAALIQMGEDLITVLRDPRDLADDEYREKLVALAELYVKGYNFDWKKFYPGSSGLDGEEGAEGARVVLPTYPFARERYWLPEPANIPVVPSTAAGPGETPAPVKEEPARVKGSLPLLADENAVIRHIQSDLTKLVEKILKVKEEYVSPEGSMLEYGFDSITLTQYVQQINAMYGIEMTLEEFFELGTPTVESLSKYLYQRFKDIFKIYLQGSTPAHSPGAAGADDAADAAGDGGVGGKVATKGLSSRELRARIEEDILQMASSLLVMNKNGYNQDSVVVFLRQLNNTFKLEITPGMFISQPSLGAFVKYLWKKHKEAFNVHG